MRRKAHHRTRKSPPAKLRADLRLAAVAVDDVAWYGVLLIRRLRVARWVAGMEFVVICGLLYYLLLR